MLASVIVASAFVLFVYAIGNRFLGLPAGVWGIVVASVTFLGVSLASRPPHAAAETFLTVAFREREDPSRVVSARRER